MIIIMGNDLDHRKGGEALCKRYYGEDKTQLAVFDANCFQNIKSNRVTFLGHADREDFGGYTPEEFVERLTNPFYKAVLPKTLTDIDLVGCEIGFITKGDGYVKKVADLLGAKDYELRVHAFSNLKAPADLVGMLVYVLDSGNAYVTGWTNKNEVLINSLEFTTVNLKKEQRPYKEKIQKLYEEISFLSSKTSLENLYQQNIDDNDKKISELEKEIVELTSTTESKVTQGKSEDQGAKIEKLTKKVARLKADNQSHLKSIEEVKNEGAESKDTITKKQMKIDSLTIIYNDLESKIMQSMVSLRTAQKEIILIQPSPLRETLDSEEVYQLSTKWTVPTHVVPINQSHHIVPSTAVPIQDPAFSFQEHKIWVPEKTSPKWSSEKFVEPKLPQLSKKEKESKDTFIKSINAENQSKPKNDQDASPSRFKKH